MASDRSDGSSSSSSVTSAATPAPGGPTTEEEDELRRWFIDQMMCLDNDVLESLLAGGHWLQVAEYLQSALAFHRGAAQAAVAFPDDAPAPNDMLHAHPELFVLPRRQYCLELLAMGEQEQPQQYFISDIFTPTRDARRTPYLEELLTQLQGLTAAGSMAELDLSKERKDTSRNIKDYLRVYFPRVYSRGPEVMASKMLLNSAAAFGEHIKEHNFRCLVCHQALAFRTSPDQHMVDHLHRHCPNMTPGIRRRLPRANRPPWG